MSCDSTAWAASAAQYNEDMVGLETACQNRVATEQAIIDAQAALDAAIEANETAIAAEIAQQQRCAQSQLATVTEAEKLGVTCGCPTPPGPTQLPSGVLGGK